MHAEPERACGASPWGSKNGIFDRLINLGILERENAPAAGAVHNATTGGFKLGHHAVGLTRGFRQIPGMLLLKQI